VPQLLAFCVPKILSVPNMRLDQSHERQSRILIPPYGCSNPPTKPPQMATISERRYRLRVPATTFVIAHSPSRFNHRDGRGSSVECTASDGADPAAVSKCDELHREWRASIWSRQSIKRRHFRALFQLESRKADQYRRENRRLVSFAIKLGQEFESCRPARNSNS